MNQARAAAVAVVAVCVAASAAVLTRGTSPGAPAADVGARDAGGAAYQCSMHPQVVAREPGSCPVCGMTLSRVEAAAAAADAGGQAASSERGSHAPLTVSAAREQLIGVKTAVVGYRELHRELRTVGKVAFDPELYAALAEHRELLGAREGLQASASAEARLRVDALWRASTLRLSLLGISSSELAALAQVGDATSLLLPGRSAWVYATILGVGAGPGLGTSDGTEVDTPRVDHPVLVTTQALPGRAFRGRLITVEPLDGRTAAARTARRDVRVRALVDTPGGGLQRGSLVDLVVEVPLGRRLAIPDDALLDTGTRRLVFVRREGGRFEPREVVLGVEGEGHHEVLAGLAAGEQVVAAATFLIDSESRFRAAQAAFAPPEEGASGRHAHEADDLGDAHGAAPR
ncbi:MAG: heavy metal-binding domain-containing protein [Thermodesulfobacteriota bacterium]